MRLRPLLAFITFGFALLVPGTAAADPAPPTFPILPNQFFDGVVNGQTAAATVYTVCPGPATGGEGHPASGQFLSVNRVDSPGITTNLGFTGSAGNSVAAAPLISSTTNRPVFFTEYFRGSALPTTWTVPCDGDGRIAFTPLPGSPTAKTDLVTVRFVNIAV